MVKKQKEETANVNATANRDIVQRLNFLYQASIYLQSVAPAASTQSQSRKAKGHQIDKSLGGDGNEELYAMAVDDPPPHEKSTDSTEVRKSTKKKPRRTVQMKNTGDLARSYVQCMRVVGQKTTVKMDPSLKRSLCSRCSTTLIPGSSASIRLKKSPAHGHVMVYMCLHCGTTKRIPAPPNTAPLELRSNLPDVGEQKTSSATDLVPIQPEALPPGGPANPRKKKSTLPRPLPLFSRSDAGHVLFCGNERLELEEEGGSGTCFS